MVTAAIRFSLLPACVDDYGASDALVRVVDAFVASLDLADLDFNRVVAATTGRRGYQPGSASRPRLGQEGVRQESFSLHPSETTLADAQGSHPGPLSPALQAKVMQFRTA